MLKAFRNGFHAVPERKHSAAQEVEDNHNQCADGADGQTVRCVGICKGINKVCAGEESAGVNHAGYAEGNQNNYRKNQVDNLALIGNRHFVFVLKNALSGGEQVTLFGIFFMLFHRTKVHIQNGNQNDH